MENARAELKKTSKISRQFCNGRYSRTIVRDVDKYQSEREFVTKTEEKLRAVLDTICTGIAMRSVPSMVMPLGRATIEFKHVLLHLSKEKASIIARDTVTATLALPAQLAVLPTMPQPTTNHWIQQMC